MQSHLHGCFLFNNLLLFLYFRNLWHTHSKLYFVVGTVHFYLTKAINVVNHLKKVTKGQLWRVSCEKLGLLFDGVVEWTEFCILFGKGSLNLLFFGRKHYSRSYPLMSFPLPALLLSCGPLSCLDCVDSLFSLLKLLPCFVSTSNGTLHPRVPKNVSYEKPLVWCALEHRGEEVDELGIEEPFCLPVSMVLPEHVQFVFGNQPVETIRSSG